MSTVTLTTRTQFAFVIVEYGSGRAFISGYSATRPAAEGRIRRLRRRAIVAPVEAGKVTVELHSCTRCGKPGGVTPFSGPGGICLDCELLARVEAHRPLPDPVHHHDVFSRIEASEEATR